MDFITTRLVRNENEDGKAVSYFYYEIAGDSSDTKPTDYVADGSIFTETNTGDVYFFNAKTETWIKQFSFQE